MRTDKELLTLLRDRTPALLGIDGGLCVVIMRLYDIMGLYDNREIFDTDDERLSYIVRKHGPRRLKDSHYRWKRGNVKPRINWINKMLARLENGEKL